MTWGFRRIGILCLCGGLTACGSPDDRLPDLSLNSQTPGETAETLSPSCNRHDPSLPYAASVVRFLPGQGAGFGQERMPDVVLGGPVGQGTEAGSLDVLSLGAGGEIILGLGDRVVTDGPGPDLIVFENPFWNGGDPERPWAELGQVSVSRDGIEWFDFPCTIERDGEGDGKGRWPGCAGWNPVTDYDPCTLLPIDPAAAGGDPFDLADIGADDIRFVKIRDLASAGEGPSAGFDLDAVGLVHYR